MHLLLLCCCCCRHRSLVHWECPSPRHLHLLPHQTPNQCWHQLLLLLPLCWSQNQTLVCCQTQSQVPALHGCFAAVAVEVTMEVLMPHHQPSLPQGQQQQQQREAADTALLANTPGSCHSQLWCSPRAAAPDLAGPAAARTPVFVYAVCCASSATERRTNGEHMLLGMAKLDLLNGSMKRLVDTANCQ